MEPIRSTDNPKIKFWYQLRSKKGRDNNSLFIIEGIKLIEEAVKSGQIFEDIIIEENKNFPYHMLDLINESNESITTTFVAEHVMKKLSDTEKPQGVLAIIKKNKPSVQSLFLQGKNCVLLVDQIQDPGNLGTIIRSADATGVDAIFLGKGTVELFNAKVVRSAMGSMFHLPIIEGDLDELIPMLQGSDYLIVGTSPYAEESFYDIDLKKKVAVLIGNEAKGLHKNRIEQVDKMVNIPIIGDAESLNVAMATTVVLYERIRQLNKA